MDFAARTLSQVQGLRHPFQLRKPAFMRALITGGAGFVGRHVCARLAKMGCAITLVDNFHPGAGWLEPERWMEHLQPDWSRVQLVHEDCRYFFRHYSANS